MSRSSKALPLVAAACALALAACGSDSKSNSSPDRTVAPRVSTNGGGDKDSGAGEVKPELVNTGEDFDAIARSFVARRNWLNQNPDPELVDDHISPDCPCFAPFRDLLADLQTNGHRARGDQVVVKSTKLVNRPAEDIAHVYVVLEPDDLALVDREGKVLVDPDADRSPVGVLYILKSVEGEWFLYQEEELGAPE